MCPTPNLPRQIRDVQTVENFLLPKFVLVDISIKCLNWHYSIVSFYMILGFDVFYLVDSLNLKPPQTLSLLSFDHFGHWFFMHVPS